MTKEEECCLDNERISGLIERSSVHWNGVQYRYPIFPFLWFLLYGRMDG